MIRVLAALLAALAMATASVLADWTATGTFRYVDRKYDYSGFTGAETLAPGPRPVATMVAPERETPGKMASDWARPIHSAVSLGKRSRKRLSGGTKAIS